MSEPPDEPYELPSVEQTLEQAYTPGRDTAVALGYAFYLSLKPHSRNNSIRKRVTTIMFVTWGVVTVLKVLGLAEGTSLDPQVYWAMTVIVVGIMSHLWGFEYGVLSSLVTGEPPEHDDDGEQ